MSPTPVELVERTGYRAPLALACTDGVTGAAVTDGLVATAWLRADPAGRRTARRSPLSGLLGFGALPRTWAQTHAQLPPGAPVTWPATAPTPVCVLVQDTAGRYLPASVAVGVPVAAPVALPLSSSPARATPSGYALVRGEVHDDTTGEPLPWALVRVDTGAAAYQTVADGRGRFLLPFPHPEALPALTDPPAGPGLGALSWPVTVSVRSKPANLIFSPGVAAAGGPDAPPELASITAQPPASLVDGGTHPQLTVTLPYGIPLVLALRAVTP